MGLGFNMLQLTDEALTAAVSCRPAVVWLAFPDVGREFAAFVPIFKEAGFMVLCMAQTLDQAEEVVRSQAAGLCNACEMSRPIQYSARTSMQFSVGCKISSAAKAHAIHHTGQQYTSEAWQAESIASCAQFRCITCRMRRPLRGWLTAAAGAAGRGCCRRARHGGGRAREGRHQRHDAAAGAC